ncbi:MAG TPA: hypothetical protein VK427_08975 [Kofleriaceae bacterium]|nr:hypothetical protein [Kofleriaceae bacterium]
MFVSSRDPRYARALARCTFGVVLITGAVVLSVRAAWTPQPHVAAVLLVTWAAATLLAIVVGACAGERHVTRRAMTASFVLPSVGIALLGPLTLHLPFALGDVRALDDWARVCALFAGPAHLVFTMLVGARAQQLVRRADAISLRRIYWTTVAVSCVPFGLMLLIPPFVVMLTAAPMLLILDQIERMIAREATSADLPRAIVV